MRKFNWYDSDIESNIQTVTICSSFIPQWAVKCWIIAKPLNSQCISIVFLEKMKAEVKVNQFSCFFMEAFEKYVKKLHLFGFLWNFYAFLGLENLNFGPEPLKKSFYPKFWPYKLLQTEYNSTEIFFR